MIGRFTGSRLGVALVGALLLGAACGGGGDSSSGGVKVTEKDFSIAVDPSSVGNGEVTFTITNEGPSTHEFVVFKSDLAPDKLPLDSSAGQVDEEGQGVQHIDEKEDIAKGASTTLKVTLDPGSYVLICNLPGHYQQGMHVGLTVT